MSGRFMNYFEFGIYVFSIIIMIATPGPVMILVASVGLQHGYQAAFKTIVGTNLASLFLIGISILLLKGMLSINAYIFAVIKIMGCLYIAYLGYGILKEVSVSHAQPLKLTQFNGRNDFKRGFLIAISNPKDIIFFSSFFPQFIGIHQNINLSLIILVSTWIVLDFLTLSMVYLGFNRIAKAKWYAHILGVCGGVLIMIALYGLWVFISPLI